MRCPECKAKNPSDASSCSTCGLILFKLSAPQRRREDLATVGRRAVDSEKQICPMCNAELAAGAVRCQHCTHILKEEVHQQVMARRRSQINYASWVAYIFGLLVFLVFRPVGLIAIGTGLMLSILYYAIPVTRESTPKRSWKEFFKAQFSLERVQVPLPHASKRKLVFIGTPILAALAGMGANFILLQRPMNQILDQNAAFHGMSVSAHYEYWMIPGVVVYDLRTPDQKHDPVVVHTALLEFASKLRAKKFDRVELQYQGTPRLSIDGASFRRLGDEYAQRNYRFGLFDFPRLVHSADEHELQLSKDSADALIELHRIWYVEEARRAALNMTATQIRV
jgi:ribosomal protein L40E